jgi:hypothetical protein
VIHHLKAEKRLVARYQSLADTVTIEKFRRRARRMASRHHQVAVCRNRIRISGAKEENKTADRRRLTQIISELLQFSNSPSG